MTMLATVEKKELLTLADYEARIYLYKEQIGTGFIGIGRTLLEAKEANVVPHGEWEAWMTRTTGLAPRQAQRCMQAAREIKDGSAMARLEMSKALLLLSSGLDEETRESIAQRAADDGIGYRDLKEQLQKAQQSAAAHTQREREYSKMLTNNGIELTRAKEEARELRKQLEQEKAQPATGISTEAQEQIDNLRAELEAAEIREERKAEQLEQLRQERQQRAMDDARGLATSTLSGFDLAAAVRAFIGSAGVLPQMGPTLRKASPAERETIRQNIDTVAAWVDGARVALGVLAVDADAARVE